MNNVSADKGYILSLNSGSSSLKFGVFTDGAEPTVSLTGRIERIGLDDSEFRVADKLGHNLADDQLNLPDHGAALEKLMDWISDRASQFKVRAVGHRLVHGGTRYTGPQILSREIESDVRQLIPLAPDHLPRELDAIEAVRRAYPDVVQVACFDTSFHRRMPAVAQMYALPRSLFENDGVLRYGFHGLSYEFITHELSEMANDGIPERTIIAHLGNGASMVAVRDGTGVETTMGFTPAGGLMMGTRSGDLDPGVFPYLLTQKKWNASLINQTINQRAGLLGVSGGSSNMHDLLSTQKTDPHAALAVEMFCYQARKYLGSLIAVLGGVDMLVFTGGIGENAPEIRCRICEKMEYAGIEIDHEANQAGAQEVSTKGSQVRVRVMETNEELMIARHTSSLLRRKTGVSHEEDKDANRSNVERSDSHS